MLPDGEAVRACDRLRPSRIFVKLLGGSTLRQLRHEGHALLTVKVLLHLKGEKRRTIASRQSTSAEALAIMRGAQIDGWQAVLDDWAAAARDAKSQ